jgi:hypothetical protein
MTHIMTSEGWKALYDTTPTWEARKAERDAASEQIDAAEALPRNTEMERDVRHTAIMTAHARFQRAAAAMLGKID